MQFSSAAEKFQQSLGAMDGVIDSYGGTEAGQLARLYRAHSLFNLGRYNDAQQAYSSFRESTGPGYLSGLALMNIALCQKMEGDLPGAAVTFQDLVNSAAEYQYPLDSALCALAECRLDSGQNEQAVTLFRRVVDEFPESAYRYVAEEKLVELGEDSSDLSTLE